MVNYNAPLLLTKLKNLTILSFQYYRLLLVYNARFTVIVIFIFTFPKFNITQEVVLFAKIIGLPSAAALYYYMAKDSYVYFRNAGYSMLRMYINAFAIDMLIYTILISLTNAYTEG